MRYNAKHPLAARGYKLKRWLSHTEFQGVIFEVRRQRKTPLKRAIQSNLPIIRLRRLVGNLISHQF